MRLPRLYRITQQLARPRIGSVRQAVEQELEKLALDRKLAPGATVGITAGSRGINNIVEILRTAADCLARRGYKPIMLAAMGSHGGGTAEGQREMLNSLGITAEAVGAPILTGAECQEVGRTSGGLSAYMLKHALGVDGILVINRVKTHTGLWGSIQSGLTKSSVVGLGGPAGAAQFHSLGLSELPNSLQQIAKVLFEKTKILAGLAIIENGYDETARIVGLPAAQFLECEPQLLTEASGLMARLPSDAIDVLIIEEMGKNYAGTGFDTNIVGRIGIQGVPNPPRPVVRRLVVLDLSEQSHGNANGIGTADLVTDKLVSKIDLPSTYLNVVTTTFFTRGAIPLHYPTEKKTIETALASLSAADPAGIRLMIVPNTLHLHTLLVSEGLIGELRARSGIDVVEGPFDFEFDAAGNMRHRLLSH